MRLLSLEVANYRNIAAAQLEPGREPVSYTHLDVYKRQVFGKILFA